jgi:hypothetical protein
MGAQAMVIFFCAGVAEILGLLLSLYPQPLAALVATALPPAVAVLVVDPKMRADKAMSRGLEAPSSAPSAAGSAKG